MARQWVKTKYPGVRYREHLTRKHGVSLDKYYSITYKLEGKTISEGVGWSSEGVTLLDAANIYGELKTNRRGKIRPFTLAEKRQMEADKRKAEEEARTTEERAETERARMETETILDKVFTSYCEAQTHKKSLSDEKGLYNKWLKPEIGKKRLHEIIPLDLERVKSKMLKAGRAVRTVEYTMAVLRQVYNYAIQHKLFKGEMPRIKIPKFNNQRQRFLTVEEAGALLDDLKEHSMTSYRIALLSLYSGMRFGEIARLRWQHIKFAQRLITLTDTKNKESRTVYMTDAVYKMFAEMETGNPGALVFPTKDEKPMQQISDSFMESVDRLGLNTGISNQKMKVVFHTLRHSCASHLVMSGVDLPTIQSILGHKTLAMTQRYSHLSSQHKTAAMNKLDKILTIPEKAEKVG